MEGTELWRGRQGTLQALPQCSACPGPSQWLLPCLHLHLTPPVAAGQSIGFGEFLSAVSAQRSLLPGAAAARRVAGARRHRSGMKPPPRRFREELPSAGVHAGTVPGALPVPRATKPRGWARGELPRQAWNGRLGRSKAPGQDRQLWELGLAVPACPVTRGGPTSRRAAAGQAGGASLGRHGPLAIGRLLQHRNSEMTVRAGNRPARRSGLSPGACPCVDNPPGSRASDLRDYSA